MPITLTDPRISFDLSAIDLVNAGVYYTFEINFAFERTSDLALTLDSGDLLTDFSATPNPSPAIGGTVDVLTASLIGANTIYIYRDMAVVRETEFQADSDFRAAVINGEFNRIIWLLQQMGMQVGDSLHKPPYDDGPNLELPDTLMRKNKLLGFDNTGAPIALDDNAQSATNAIAAALNSATSARSASISATAADSARSLAEAAVEKMGWSDVVFVTTADSPFTISDTSVGKMYSFDCSGGDIIVNLDAISTLSLGGIWAVGLIKRDSSGYQITVNSSGTDVIGETQFLTIGTRNSGVTLVPDTDLTPSIWTPMRFGAVSGNMSVASFLPGLDYIADVDTTITLPVAPGNLANIMVMFDGIGQHRTSMSLLDTALSFAVPIPSSVAEIEVWIGTTISIGVPADGTITKAKLATGLNLGGPSLGLDSIIRTNGDTISEDITIPTGSNGMSAGPITIADTFSVTVNGTWSIV